MTLSAITKGGKVITPYKMIASGNTVEAHETYQAIDRLLERGVGLFCLDCYYEYGEYFPVGLRKTDTSKTKPHFAHPPSQACQSKPASKESINHRTAKEFLAKYLEDADAKVFVERRMKSGDTCRQPDVMAVFPDRVEAHEIQLSRIDSNALRQRSIDLANLLAEQYPDKRVRINWYLSPKNQIDDNWLVFRAADWWGYKIWFDDDIPSWQLASPEIVKKSVLAEAKARREKSRQKADRELWAEQKEEQRKRQEKERRQWAASQELERQRRNQQHEEWLRRQEKERDKQRKEYQRELERQNRYRRFQFQFWLELWSKFDLPPTLAVLRQCIADLERQSVEEARQKVLDRIATVGYKKGDLVRGVPGRASANWKGTVVNVQPDGNIYVDWDGRRRHSDPRVKRQPVLFMLKEQVTPIC